MNESFLPLYTRHERQFESFRYVYPVLSRRSGGLSIGINLNPDTVCNFDCVYCQVDRRSPPRVRDVDEEILAAELRAVASSVASGEIYDVPKFRDVPPHLRRLNDIAFSGDGEPTSYRNFAGVVERAANVRDELGLSGTKLVVITNATLLHRPAIRETFRYFDGTQGEIWAKLDAGTEDYYRRIERTSIPFRRVLENITLAAQQVPLTIQSLFMRLEGEPPSEAEIGAYCERLNEVTAAGGTIRLVQIYTVARVPAEAYVSHLTRNQVDAIAATVRTATGLDVAAFYGPE